MSGLPSIEDLRKKLIEDARRKSEEIIRKAEEEARKIIEDAEREWSKRAKAKREEILKDARRRAQIILSDAKTQARLILSSAKHEVLQQLFNDVMERIRRRDNIDVKTSLTKLLEEALNYIEKPSKVIVNPSDKDVITEVLREKGLSDVIVEAREDIIGGVIVVDNAGRKVDNSYNTRFERAKTVFASTINKYLWGRSE